MNHPLTMLVFLFAVCAGALCCYPVPLAGLAGACEVSGPIGQLIPAVSPGYGYAAIIVAWLGRLHPLGMCVSGLFLGLIYMGGAYGPDRAGCSNRNYRIIPGFFALPVIGKRFPAAISTG